MLSGLEHDASQAQKKKNKTNWWENNIEKNNKNEEKAKIGILY